MAPETLTPIQSGSQPAGSSDPSLQWTPTVPPPPPAQRRNWVWGLVSVGVVAGVIAAGTVGLQSLGRDQMQKENLKMTVPARVEDLTARLRVSGKVQPIRQVNVSPRDSGQLIALYADQGDQVQQGQLLARMYYGDLEGGLTQAQGRVQELKSRLAEQNAGERPQSIAQAQARVDAARALVTLAEWEARRFEELGNQGAVSQNQLNSKRSSRDQAQADLKAAESNLALLQAGSRPEELAQTQAQILQAQGQLIQQQARVRDTEIRAPFSGIVIQRYADIGAFVTPTTSASESTAATSSSILALADGLEVRADVPESQIGGVSIGQRVELKTTTFPDQVFRGQVRKIAPATVVVRDVTVFQVTIDPQEGLDRLRSGMNVSVDFVGDTSPNALVVPSVAVIYQNEQQGVIVLDPQTQQPVYRVVKVGITQSGKTQILDGLKTDERVFTALPPGKTLMELTGSDTSSDIDR